MTSAERREIQARAAAYSGKEVEADPEGREFGTTCAGCGVAMIVDRSDEDWTQGVDVCVRCARDRAEQGQADRVALLAEVERLGKALHDVRNTLSAFTMNAAVFLHYIKHAEAIEGNHNPWTDDPDWIELVADLRQLAAVQVPAADRERVLLQALMDAANGTFTLSPVDPVDIARRRGWLPNDAEEAMVALVQRGLARPLPSTAPIHTGAWSGTYAMSTDLHGLVEDLIGGIESDTVTEAGGVLPFAEGLAEGSCDCDDDPTRPEYETMGLHCEDSATWCLRCQASALLDGIEGREPGSTVLAERAELKQATESSGEGDGT